MQTLGACGGLPKSRVPLWGHYNKCNFGVSILGPGINGNQHIGITGGVAHCKDAFSAAP